MTTKKRVSKACDTCRKSKTKCDGERPCQRCLSENKICTYSNSSIGYSEGKLKKLYNQEYVDLLETRVSLLTKSLSLLFLEFDKVLESGVLRINPDQIARFKQVQYESLMLRQGGATIPLELNNHSSEACTDDGSSDDADIGKPAEVWSRLLQNKETFINETTGKLNINQVVYSIIPTNVDMAVKSVNFSALDTEDTNELKRELNTQQLRPDDISPEVADKFLSNGYVNKHILLTADRSKDGLPQNTHDEPCKRRRRSKVQEMKEKNNEHDEQNPIFERQEEAHIKSEFPQQQRDNSMASLYDSSLPSWYDSYSGNGSQPFYPTFTGSEGTVSREEFGSDPNDSLAKVHIGIKPIQRQDNSNK